MKKKICYVGCKHSKVISFHHEQKNLEFRKPQTKTKEKRRTIILASKKVPRAIYRVNLLSSRDNKKVQFGERGETSTWLTLWRGMERAKNESKTKRTLRRNIRVGKTKISWWNKAIGDQRKVSSVYGYSRDNVFNSWVFLFRMLWYHKRTCL